MDLSGFSPDAPRAELPVLFVHHSIGGQLLAPTGEDRERERCIYDSHPMGGGLRPMLEGQGYVVHEASYGSRVGNDTDLFHWLPKFRDDMDRILRVREQDDELPDGQRNQIVVFKSCFPNSKFLGEGSPPGRVDGPELTLWNAKATMLAVRDVLAQHPDVLFVYMTAPPHAPKLPAEPAWRWLAKKALGKIVDDASLRRSGALARRFNNWLKDPEGWLMDYPQQNLVVFDYYDVLTGHGETNLLRYPTEGGFDSHPSGEGNGAAAAAFVPFLNRAVRRAGLAPTPGSAP